MCAMLVVMRPGVGEEEEGWWWCIEVGAAGGGGGYQKLDCFLFSPLLPSALSVKMAFYFLSMLLLPLKLFWLMKRINRPG